MRNISVVFVLCFLVGGNCFLPNNPCPEIFEYNEINGIWTGFIRLKANAETVVHSLEVKMSIAATLTHDYLGHIERVPTDEDQRNCTLTFKMHFPINDTVPSIKLISYNDKIVCKGPPASGVFITTLGLTHTTKLNCKHPNNLSKESIELITNFNNDKLTENVEKLSKICGIISMSQSLVVYGRPSARGAFPWLVAIYFRNRFICGGNLISQRHVLTAAHCVVIADSEDLNDFDVYLGKHDLYDRNVTQGVIENIQIHPHYHRDNWNLADADIAIITIEEVSLTRAVWPVCVFNDPIDTDQFVGQLGTVAGWGKDENGEEATHELRQTTVTIVNQNRCNSSHPEYVNVHRSFCAGGVGRGACSGDSGGGLFIRHNHRWFLRGIVSVSISGKWNKSGCDLHNYGLYTDVCRFTDWVNHFLEYL